ncbi:MAG TPA: GTP-binding protein [Pilimelia sp.]|nr:GTP-binding protein [Pilimelia sp.]
MPPPPSLPASTPVLVDPRPSLTVISGFWPTATFAIARALLAADPSLLLVRHDMSAVRDGVIHRVVRTGAGVLEDEPVTLASGGVPGALRDDVVPTLCRLARTLPGRDILLLVPEVVEAQAVASACAQCTSDGAPIDDLLRVDSYVTVVAAEHLIDGLASTDDLAHLGIQTDEDDHRCLAEVITRQIEYADTVVLWGQCPDGAFATARLSVLLQRIAPWASHLTVGDHEVIDATELTRRLRHRHRHDAAVPDVLARGVEGFLLGVHEPVPDCGVVSTVFRTRRPFHPDRLNQVLQSAAADTLRSRGHLWLATQPDTVIAWQSAGGGVSMTTLGRWLVAEPDARWEEVNAHRRLTAALDWDPYYGDRNTHLVFIGLHFDPARLHRRLARCLLTDAELASGEENWRALPDPFAGCFPTDPGAAGSANRPHRSHGLR